MPADVAARALGIRFAAEHVTNEGYVVRDRDVDTRHGRVGVVATDGPTLVFIDVFVQIRSGRPPAEQAWPAGGPEARRTARRRSAAWLSEPVNRVPVHRTLRYDAIRVVINPAGELTRLDHVEGAF
jgi:putative endonuclease